MAVIMFVTHAVTYTFAVTVTITMAAGHMTVSTIVLDGWPYMGGDTSSPVPVATLLTCSRAAAARA